MKIGTYNVLGLKGYPPEEATNTIGKPGDESNVAHFAQVFTQLDCDILALQEGIHLPTSESEKRLLQVRLAMRPPHETFSADMTVADSIERASHSSMRAWPVTDKNGVWGVVSLEQLEKALDEKRSDAKVGDLLDSRTFPHLHADHSLDLALERMGKAGYDLLPVVSRANVHEMEGVCSLLDVLRAFGVHGRQPGARDPDERRS